MREEQEDVGYKSCKLRWRSKQPSSSYIMNRKSWRWCCLLSVLKRMFRAVVRVSSGLSLQATHGEHNEVNCHTTHETKSKGGAHQNGNMWTTVFFNLGFVSIINRWKLKKKYLQYSLKNNTWLDGAYIIYCTNSSTHLVLFIKMKLPKKKIII